MFTSMRICLAGVFALFVSTFLAYSGDNDKTVSDATFVRKASESDLTEIELGKLAGKISSNSRVREFGAKMVKDHAKTSDELGPLAKKLGFTVAKDMSKQHKEISEKLSKANPSDFDRQYITGQVKAHREAVELFKQEAKSGKSAELREFASRVLPIIEEHLRLAQTIAGAGETKQ